MGHLFGGAYTVEQVDGFGFLDDAFPVIIAGNILFQHWGSCRPWANGNTSDSRCIVDRNAPGEGIEPRFADGIGGYFLL